VCKAYLPRNSVFFEYNNREIASNYDIKEFKHPLIDLLMIITNTISSLAPMLKDNISQTLHQLIFIYTSSIKSKTSNIVLVLLLMYIENSMREIFIN